MHSFGPDFDGRELLSIRLSISAPAPWPGSSPLLSNRSLFTANLTDERATNSELFGNIYVPHTTLCKGADSLISFLNVIDLRLKSCHALHCQISFRAFDNKIFPDCQNELFNLGIISNTERILRFPILPTECSFNNVAPSCPLPYAFNNVALSIGNGDLDSTQLFGVKINAAFAVKESGKPSGKLLIGPFSKDCTPIEYVHTDKYSMSVPPQLAQAIAEQVFVPLLPQAVPA